MTSRPRLIVLGIDGATWDVVQPYIEAGHLPAFQRLVKEGAWGELRSIHPPVTACCWPTIFTGTNPGKHGVFEFFTFREGTYDRRPTTFLDWRQPPLWKLLNHAGLSVGVFNVPVTFPAQPVDGYMVSGEMGTPRVDRQMFWPEEAGQAIGRRLKQYELEPISGTTRRQVRRLTRQIAARNEAALVLIDQMPTDVVLIVVNYVDHAQHFFWEERFEGLHAHAQKCNPVLLAHRGADSLLASLQERAGEDCTVVVLSDHGAGPTRGCLDLDRMLAGLGYLEFTQTPSDDRSVPSAGRAPQALRPLARRLMKCLPSRLRRLARELNAEASVDHPASRVFSVGTCCSLRVNLSGREPAGCVPAAEREDICLELRQALSQTEGLDGGPLFDRIYENGELYRGPHVRLGPDLVGVPDGYSVLMTRGMPPQCHWLVSRADGQTLGLPHFVRSGSHRLDGIVGAVGPGVKSGHLPHAASIVDVTPTVMALLGLSTPDYMDGDVMPWVRADIRCTITERPMQRPAVVSQDREAYSPAEEAAVSERLKQLGYLD